MTVVVLALRALAFIPQSTFVAGPVFAAQGDLHGILSSAANARNHFPARLGSPSVAWIRARGYIM